MKIQKPNKISPVKYSWIFWQIGFWQILLDFLFIWKFSAEAKMPTSIKIALSPKVADHASGPCHPQTDSWINSWFIETIHGLGVDTGNLH